MLIEKSKNCIIFISVILFLYALNTAVIAQDIESKVDEYIDAYMKMGMFSGSILIAQNGKILISKGYGMANYEHDVPNTPQTKFRIASMTKQFTAAAIMQLQEKGLLSVNDPIIKYIPDYPETGKEITIHHLLTHTSGIPNFTSLPEYEKTMMLPSPVEKSIELFKYKPLEFAPGERFKYCNSGYLVLGYIIEKISGKSYEEYMQENIFQPLNMKDTGCDQHSTVLKHRAAGYALTEDGLVNASYIDITVPHAGGALYSTVEDLYKWDRALYTEKLVKKSSLEKMFTPFKGYYGYGWVITSLFNRRRINHEGGINGFNSDISRYIDDDVFITVLSNTEGAKIIKISKDIAAIVFGEKYEFPKKRKIIKVDPKIFDAYVGDYEASPQLHFVITKEDDHLYAQVTGRPIVRLYPKSETQFFIMIVDAQITFVKNEKGEVTQLIFHMESEETPAKKIK